MAIGPETGRTPVYAWGVRPMAITPEDFGTSFKGFLDQMRAQKKPEEAPFFVSALARAFCRRAGGFPVVSDSFAAS